MEETSLLPRDTCGNSKRRGYLKAGGFIPEVVLDHPDMVRAMHQEFVHAGTDVVEAFTVGLVSFTLW